MCIIILQHSDIGTVAVVAAMAATLLGSKLIIHNLHAKVGSS